MKKIRAAIVGYGNIGHFVLDALQVAPDFEIAGIVRRRVSEVPIELSAYPVVSSLDELKDVDVAILVRLLAKWSISLSRLSKGYTNRG